MFNQQPSSLSVKQPAALKDPFFVTICQELQLNNTVSSVSYLLHNIYQTDCPGVKKKLIIFRGY